MTYNLDINDRALLAIKEGRKKVEIRATKNNFDYANIKKNDIIKFESFSKDKLNCLVTDNIWYKSIEELLTCEGTEYTLSSTNDFDEGVKSINSLNGYKEAILKNGVYAIHVEPIVLSNLLLKDTDIDMYIKYREEVKNNMEHPDWLGDFSKEDIESLLKIGSKIFMFYLNDLFVCSMMLLPADEKGLRNLNLDLDYKKVIDYGPIFVNPKFIGNNLQYQMLQYLDKFCNDLGYEFAASTVHPNNIYCINNFIKDGFNLEGQVILKRGTRNVYLKKLN